MGFVVLLGMQQAQAFDREDLKRLKETNKCPKCNLQGANLKGANLEYVNLQGANLWKSNLRGANLEAANGRIVDVDIAEETSALAKYNIMVQASAALLAQARAPWGAPVRGPDGSEYSTILAAPAMTA